MLTIVILNYNGWRDTIDCLMSLRQQTYRDFRVIVADNGSTDGSVLRLREWADASNIHYRMLKDGDPVAKDSAWLYLLPFAENHGFAKGNNMAIETMRREETDYYWCLNNDTVVEPDCLEKMVRYMDEPESKQDQLDLLTYGDVEKQLVALNKYLRSSATSSRSYATGIEYEIE